MQAQLMCHSLVLATNTDKQKKHNQRNQNMQNHMAN